MLDTDLLQYWELHALLFLTSVPQMWDGAYNKILFTTFIQEDWRLLGTNKLQTSLLPRQQFTNPELKDRSDPWTYLDII